MEFDTQHSDSRVRVELHRKDYKLTRARRLKGVGENPLVINYQGDDTLRSAEITIQFLVTNHKLEGLKNFWSVTEKDWKILIYVNDAIFLQGFLLVTDHSTEPMTDDNYVLTLKATDGLSLLDAVDFKDVELYGPFKNTSFPYTDIPAVEIVNDYLNRRYPASELLARSLTKTLLCDEINEFTNIYDENMVQSLPMYFQSLIHIEGLKDAGRFVDSRKVLESILDAFVQICFQKNGKWIITSVAELSKTRQKGRRLDMIYGSLLENIEQISNESLDHASKLTRFYFIKADAVRWYVAPFRQVIAKLTYKPGVNLLKAGNFLYYNQSDNNWGFWAKTGSIFPQRVVEDGYSNVMRFNGDGLDPRTNYFTSEIVKIPAKHKVAITFLIKRKGRISATEWAKNLMVRFDLKNDNKNYRLAQYQKGTTNLPDVALNDGPMQPDDRTFKGGTLRTVKTSVNPISQDRWGRRSMWFSLYYYFDSLVDTGNRDEVDEDEYVEHTILMEDISVLNDKLDSTFSVSFAQPTRNVVLDLASIEIRVTNLSQQVKGERIELTNDEPSTEQAKSIDLAFQDGEFEYDPQTIINGRSGFPTNSWRRLGREEGKSLGELTAEMTFNNGINHRPYFESSFVTRKAPFHYGDTFTYNQMKYLAQDYEYNVLKDEIHARIIRPIGDCEYNHKAEFWDISKDNDDIGPILTKRYVVDSSACADKIDIEPQGGFFEFNGLAVDEKLWREAENEGSNLITVNFGEFFTFGGVQVDETLWRESEGQGTDISTQNAGSFFEFNFVVDETLWRESEGAGSELNTDLQFGQFFNFELIADLTAWNEAENAGRNPDFSNEDFSNEFDIVE